MVRSVLLGPGEVVKWGRISYTSIVFVVGRGVSDVM